MNKKLLLLISLLTFTVQGKDDFGTEVVLECNKDSMNHLITSCSENGIKLENNKNIYFYNPPKDPKDKKCDRTINVKETTSEECASEILFEEDSLISITNFEQNKEFDILKYMSLKCELQGKNSTIKDCEGWKLNKNDIYVNDITTSDKNMVGKIAKATVQINIKPKESDEKLVIFSFSANNGFDFSINNESKLTMSSDDVANKTYGYAEYFDEKSNTLSWSFISKLKLKSDVKQDNNKYNAKIDGIVIQGADLLSLEDAKDLLNEKGDKKDIGSDAGSVNKTDIAVESTNKKLSNKQTAIKTTNSTETATETSNKSSKVTKTITKTTTATVTKTASKTKIDEEEIEDILTQTDLEEATEKIEDNSSVVLLEEPTNKNNSTITSTGTSTSTATSASTSTSNSSTTSASASTSTSNSSTTSNATTSTSTSNSTTTTIATGKTTTITITTSTTKINQTSTKTQPTDESDEKETTSLESDDKETGKSNNKDEKETEKADDDDDDDDKDDDDDDKDDDDDDKDKDDDDDDKDKDDDDDDKDKDDDDDDDDDDKDDDDKDKDDDDDDDDKDDDKDKDDKDKDDDDDDDDKDKDDDDKDDDDKDDDDKDDDDKDDDDKDDDDDDKDDDKDKDNDDVDLDDDDDDDDIYDKETEKESETSGYGDDDIPTESPTDKSDENEKEEEANGGISGTKLVVISTGVVAALFFYLKTRGSRYNIVNESIRQTNNNPETERFDYFSEEGFLEDYDEVDDLYDDEIGIEANENE